MEQCAMDMMDLIRKLNDMGERVIFLGDVVPVYREWRKRTLTVEYDFAPASSNRQRQPAWLPLAWNISVRGKTVTTEEFEPDYLRKSRRQSREREEEASQSR